VPLEASIIMSTTCKSTLTHSGPLEGCGQALAKCGPARRAAQELAKTGLEDLQWPVGSCS